jgi:hypothetical protein
MTLPDTAFFDLMRSALGNIRTPFNKQKLLEDLSAFLSRPEIQETIAAFLDRADRRIIAAVAALGEPVPGELESFFSGEYSYAALHSLLLNLEERFVIYRFREDSLFRIALNPRLENILAPVCRSRLFFPLPVSGAPDRTGVPASAEFSPRSGPPPGTEARAPAEAKLLDARLLAALFSFFLSGRSFIRPDIPDRGGGLLLRKKAAEEAEKLFPGLDMETIAGAFLSLGVFERDGEKLRAGGKRLSAFRELSPAGRLEYLAAGSALYLQSLEPNPLPGYVRRSLLAVTVRFINSLLATLGFVDTSASEIPPEARERGGTSTPREFRVYPKPALFKCGELLRRNETDPWNFAGELPSTGIILRALETTGLILPSGEDYAVPLWRAEEASAAVAEASAVVTEASVAEASAGTPVIAMDSPFSLILYPGISFADALDLALFCDVRETGTAVRFSLSRESVVRGFNRGFRAAYLWDLLERCSGGRAGEALKWNLEDWEKRCREVALYQGVVLGLGGERGYLAESGPLAARVRGVLAPGVFLLDASSREEAAEFLREAGVDIISLPELHALESPLLPAAENGIPAGGTRRESGGALFPEVFTAQNTGPGGGDAAGTPPESVSPADSANQADSVNPPEPQSPADSWDEEKADRLKEKFRACLDSAGKRYGKEDRAELLARIERRLVVSESQLQDISIRYEKLEARSLDYAGKTAIARQAIVQGSLLEVAWPSGGSEETLLGTPENLEKKGGEIILVLRPRSGRAEPVKIPLGKISVLRRIKQSIFGE